MGPESKLYQKLRISVRDLMMINDKHRSMIGKEIEKNINLEKEIKELKQERSDYYNVS